MPQFNRFGARASQLLIASALGALLGRAMPALPEEAVRVGPTRIEQGALILDGVPPTLPTVASALPRYLESRSASFVDWLADGSMLIATRFGDTDQLHRVRSPGGAREQLSFERDAVNRAAAHPFNSDTLIFLEDRDGNERTQLFLQQLGTGALTPLTHDTARNETPLWAHDGKRIAFASNRRDGNDVDIYVGEVAVTGLQPQLLAGGTGNRWRLMDWSPDDRQLLLIRTVSAAQSELHLVNVATGEITAVDPMPAPAKSRSTRARAAAAPAPGSRVQSARFAPDGRGVLFLGDRGSEYLRLRYADPGSGEVRDLSPAMNSDVVLFDASADGRYLAYVYDDQGESRVTVVDQLHKLEMSPAGLPAGVISSLRFDRAGRRLALTLESAQTPRDVYVFEPDTRTSTRWTQSEIGPVDPSRFVAPTLLHFETWDRDGGQPRQLQAFVYRPIAGPLAGPVSNSTANAAVGPIANPGAGRGMHPVLLLLHDDPAGQYRPAFDPFLQYVVNELGFVVVAPNLRGSAGAGSSFAALDDGALREDALRDIGSLLVWIGLQRDLDPHRVLAMGEGYGGYLTLGALAQYGERLCGGVDVAGISDFVSYLENAAPYARDAARAEYGDERDTGVRAFLQRISPLNSVAGLRQPLLIVQGLQDRQVPPSESEQLLARLRAGNRTTGYLAALDEGHEFSRKPNRATYYAAIATFLARQIAPGDETGP